MRRYLLQFNYLRQRAFYTYRIVVSWHVDGARTHRRRISPECGGGRAWACHSLLQSCSGSGVEQIARRRPGIGAVHAISLEVAKAGGLDVGRVQSGPLEVGAGGLAVPVHQERGLCEEAGDREQKLGQRKSGTVLRLRYRQESCNRLAG